MVEPSNPQLSVRRQCELLGVNRNRLIPPPPKTSPMDLQLMRWIDELHMQEPTFGTRGLNRLLVREHGCSIGRARMRRLMRQMGIAAIYPKPRLSIPGKGHRIYPYLLRNLDIGRPNQVWCVDITYIPMPHGFCYLVAIMDWYSRKVLSWSVSTTMDIEFCLLAFRKAVAIAGTTPEIMNSDQGSQFTSDGWIKEMKSHKNLKISMDGKGRWVDNVFIERLWWSLKYEDIYLRSYSTPREVEIGVTKWFEKFNQRRPHSSLEDATPDEVYYKISAGNMVA